MKVFENIFPPRRSISDARFTNRVILKRMVLGVALMLPLSVAAQQTTLTDIKIRFREGKKREQVEKDAKLNLDDTARQLAVLSRHRPFDVNYDDVQKIIIEPDSYAGEIGFGAGMALLAVGPRLGPKPDRPREGAHLVYVEYKKRDGETSSYLMILGKNAAPEGVKRIKSVFGERAVLPDYEETPEKLDKKQFASTRSSFVVRGSASEHPTAAIRADKALVVVAAPPSWGVDPVGTEKWVEWEAKIIVNDQVVGVNGPGTYTHFYLDHGEHLIVTQANDTTGLRLKLEAGKEYYLLQTIVFFPNFKSFLVRHSREIVMHEIKDLLWAEWKPKD